MKRQYQAGPNGERIDVTPLPRRDHWKLAVAMLRWKIRYNRRIVLLKARLSRR